MSGYFITGTSTEVGKTFVTTLLLHAFRKQGIDAVGYKPVACGSREDAIALHEACDGSLTIEAINPLYYQMPAAPMAAALIENRPVDWEKMLAGAHALAGQFSLVLVEGIGGWKVPLSENRTMADFAVALGWPVLLVVDNRLGALNHTLLTLESIEKHGLHCVGLILNQTIEERDAASITNRAILEASCQVPILDEILFDQTEIALPAALDRSA